MFHVPYGKKFNVVTLIWRLCILRWIDTAGLRTSKGATKFRLISRGAKKVQKHWRRKTVEINGPYLLRD